MITKNNSNKENEIYNKYMRKYQKEKYHICAEYRKTMLVHSKKCYEKNKKMILGRIIDYYKNPRIKAYKKEYDHLTKYETNTPEELEKKKQKLRQKYKIKTIIKCENKK